MLDVGHFAYVPNMRGAVRAFYVSDAVAQYCVDATDLPFCDFIANRRAYMALNISANCAPLIRWLALVRADVPARIKQQSQL